MRNLLVKIAEIRELSTKELVERIDAVEVAAYDQKVINHSISPSENLLRLNNNAG